MKNCRKKKTGKNISSLDQHVGLVSLEKNNDATEFTIRVLEVNHLRYSYDPKKKKFELHFLSLKQSSKTKHRSPKGQRKERVS